MFVAFSMAGIVESNVEKSAVVWKVVFGCAMVNGII